MRTGSNQGTVAAAVVVMVAALGLAACSDDPDRDPGTGGTGNTGNTGGSGNTGNTGGSGNSGNYGGALPTDASVMFLHHSTGGVVWEGDGTTTVSSALSTLNAAGSTSYTAEAQAYPDSPYPWQNYPYDYWHLWVDGQAGTEGVPTLQSFTDAYDVVVFKHCFPVSGIGPDSGSADIASQDKTIENYELQYNALKEYLHGFSDNRFIVWTGAALTLASSSEDAGGRARQFFEWVTGTWDEPGDNIFVWDFFALETEGGNFLLDEYSADGGGDSHPSPAFAAVAAPLFAQRIVDVIEGRGDTGSLTGE